MADISQINLPNGTTYDIVAKKAYIPFKGATQDNYVPLIATNGHISPSNQEIFIPTFNGPQVNLKDGTLDFEQSIIDISEYYTVTKTSGNWSCHSVTAYKMGKFVLMSMSFKGNGSSVSAGNNAFVGTISGSLLPIGDMSIKEVSYLGSSVPVASISSTGALSIRMCGANATLGSTSYTSFVFRFLGEYKTEE